MITTLVWVVIIAAVSGLALWAIDALGVVDPTIRRVARVVIVVVAILLIIGLVASLFGVDTGMPRMTVQ